MLSDETRPNRISEIKTSNQLMTIGAILTKYPRFKDFEGELVSFVIYMLSLFLYSKMEILLIYLLMEYVQISREFLAEYPQNDVFIGKFPTIYAPKILAYCKQFKPSLLPHVSNQKDGLYIFYYSSLYSNLYFNVFNYFKTFYRCTESSSCTSSIITKPKLHQTKKKICKLTFGRNCSGCINLALHYYIYDLLIGQRNIYV